MTLPAVRRRGIHRVTPNSVSGRRMTSAKGAVEVGSTSKLTEAQRQWNAKLEVERKEKAKP